MKKLLTVSIILTMLMSVDVMAKKLPTVAMKLPSQLKEVIAENLSYPTDAKNENLEGDVWMKICLSENSKIKIVDLSATNEALGSYVKEELSSLYVNNPGCKAGQVYYLKVKFDLNMKE